jgi:isoleucyl-tRNA synthetase
MRRMTWCTAVPAVIARAAIARAAGLAVIAQAAITGAAGLAAVAPAAAIIAVALAAALVGAPRIARADEPPLPFLKDGLWESHIHQTVNGQQTEHTVRMCQTADTQRQERAFSASLRQRNQCTYSVKRQSANVYVSENRCQSGALAGTLSKGTMTFQGDTAYHDEVHVLQSGNVKTTITDAKYVGACPTDMKPGDTIFDNSVRSNISETQSTE